MNQQVIIDRRFRGPPDSANGGYACGLVAEGIHGIAQVSLRVPPPLDKPLLLEGDGSESRLLDGQVLVGEAQASTLDLDVPVAPGLGEAEAAMKGYVGFEGKTFTGCFVCGPERPPGDGLNIFAGPVEGRGMVASPWTPDASLVGPEGDLDRRHVWAALDCPSYFAIEGAPVALLARLTAQIDRMPEVGQPLVALAWSIGTDGRKHWSGSALATADGDVVAVAEALWIEVPGLTHV